VKGRICSGGVENGKWIQLFQKGRKDLLLRERVKKLRKKKEGSNRSPREKKRGDGAPIATKEANALVPGARRERKRKNKGPADDQ